MADEFLTKQICPVNTGYETAAFIFVIYIYYIHVMYVIFFASFKVSVIVKEIVPQAYSNLGVFFCSHRGL